MSTIDYNYNVNLSHRLAKLHKVQQTYGGIVIGVDFDNTLVDSTNEYKLFTDVVDIIKRAKQAGHTLCVWTANKEKELVDAKWAEAGLTYDYYNESPIQGMNGTKPHFNLLLDDSAGLGEALITLDLLLAMKD